MPEPWPVPELTAENAEFFSSGDIRLQHCSACGHVQHPPVPICGSCQESEFDYRPGSRTGTIESFTVVHHPVHPMLVDRVPYNVVVVALDEPEGIRIVGNLLAEKGRSIGIGLRVSATCAEVDALLLPQWEVLD